MKKIFKDIVILLVIIIAVGYFILSRDISDLDEIWNYNTARAISEGKIPYKDVSMITTPLLPIINATFLKIFPNELMTMRLLAITLISCILFFIYQIFKKLKINDSLSIFATIIIGFLLKNYICIDYNFFVLFITLLIIFLELRETKKERWHNLLIGLLGGLCITTKQTTGILISFAIIGYKVIFALKDYFTNKKIDKEQLKQIGFRILGIIIPIIIMIIYLVINGAFKDFIDYCVLGIKTFDNKISYINLIKSKNFIIKMMSIGIPIFILAMFILSIKYKKQELFILTCLGIAEFVVAFPISDNIHFLIGSIPTLIGITYILNKIIEKTKIRINPKINIFIGSFFDCLSSICIFLVFIFILNTIYEEKIKEKHLSDLEHFKNIEISQDLENTINEVDKYIQGNSKNVYILNFDSALYMIPINRYNKNYDMFLKGNIGSRGEDGQIEKIKKTDAQFLIVKEGINRNWQNPEKVRKYIIENMKKVGTIENFDIYEN